MRHDHFSRQAAGYAVYRPSYPAALFDYLASVAPARRRAWDCATGSGQAAEGLARLFDEVIATDASAAQIAHAHPHPRVEYHVAPAEASGIEAGTMDIATVAQAAHWLDLDAFYAEARRVLVADGVIALWSYGSASLDSPALSAAFDEFENVTVGPYWPPERRLIVEGYLTIPFPFAELRPPPFTLEQRWTLDELLGYVGTWSAIMRYRDGTGTDPVLLLERALAPLWGPRERARDVVWPLALRVGVVGAGGRAPER
jgi:SAM-dependent methyltransferase